METIEISTPFIRLDSLLKFAGFAQTGGEAKLIILDRDVRINGEVCTLRGKKCFPGDIISAGERTFRVLKKM